MPQHPSFQLWKQKLSPDIFEVTLSPVGNNIHFIFIVISNVNTECNSVVGKMYMACYIDKTDESPSVFNKKLSIGEKEEAVKPNFLNCLIFFLNGPINRFWSYPPHPLSDYFPSPSASPLPNNSPLTFMPFLMTWEPKLLQIHFWYDFKKTKNKTKFKCWKSKCVA